MASHPPATCCTIGVKHEGEPTGTTIRIGDNTETYIAAPPAGTPVKGGIYFITDVIGIYNNSQLMADQFAANGYYVIMPDLFRGDPVKMNHSADFDFMKWIAGHGLEKIEPICDAAIKHLKDEPSLKGKKLGGVGYCFGGKYVARYLKKGKLDAGYTAHPSFVTPEELKGIEGPFSISAAETDSIFPAEKRAESEKILKEIGATYQINLFSGVEHGFAVRGDLSNAKVTFAKEQAFLQAVAWFDHYLA